MDNLHKSAIRGLLLNTCFCIYYTFTGIVSRSWWLSTLGCYYLMLSILRFLVVAIRKREGRIKKIAGVIMMLMTIPLIGTVVLAVVKDRGKQLHEIIMITVALYAFAKITLAAINLIKAKHGESDRWLTLRNISFAEAVVSIFALQRSMLVSFEGMSASQIQIMNTATGAGVCAIVFLLGLNLIKRNS